METYSNQQSMPRLISLLESLLTSTHQSKVGIEAHSNEAQKLLDGWVLPEHEAHSDILCQCAESQKQQLVAFLDKVEKAVKYSQSVREGRSDISNPWPDEITNSISKEEIKKATKGVPIQKVGFGFSREKFIKGRLPNGSSKRPNGNSSSSVNRTNSYTTEKQEQHSSLCPLHDGFQSEHLRKAKSVPTVGLAEALDVKGIPPELVTVLKSVHHYINRLRTTNAKNRAEATFLKHLSVVNEKRWKQIPTCGLLKDLDSVLSRGRYGKIPMLKEKEESKLAVSQLDDSLPFIGVWNPAICSTITVDALCVQYQNADIWNLLQMRIQQLQLAQAEWQVCNILSCDSLLCNPDLHLAAAPLFLKAATALSRLTALNLPVLVKTCSDQ